MVEATLRYNNTQRGVLIYYVESHSVTVVLVNCACQQRLRRVRIMWTLWRKLIRFYYLPQMCGIHGLKTVSTELKRYKLKTKRYKFADCFLKENFFKRYLNCWIWCSRLVCCSSPRKHELSAKVHAERHSRNLNTIYRKPRHNSYMMPSGKAQGKIK